MGVFATSPKTRELPQLLAGGPSRRALIFGIGAKFFAGARSAIARVFLGRRKVIGTARKNSGVISTRFLRSPKSSAGPLWTPDFAEQSCGCVLFRCLPRSRRCDAVIHGI
jgi:hypothetical protein